MSKNAKREIGLYLAWRALIDSADLSLVKLLPKLHELQL